MWNVLENSKNMKVLNIFRDNSKKIYNKKWWNILEDFMSLDACQMTRS